MVRIRDRAILFPLVLCGTILIFLALPRMLARRQHDGSQARIVGNHQFPMTVTDSLNRTVKIAKPPKRIISLAPGVTEMLFAVGAGDRVIADTTYCDYPAAAAKLPKIGGYLDPNIEKITSLNPDLIVAERGNRRDILDHLHALGITIIAVDPGTIEDISHSIQLIGDVTGMSARAATIKVDYDARRESVVGELAHLPNAECPRTLFLFSLDGGVYTVGPGSHVDEMIHLAGGRNIAAATGKPWPQLAMETVVSADPQVILVVNMGGSTKLTDATALAKLRADARWRPITAVRNGRVAVLDDDLITIPGPRVIDGLEQMAAALHPERFSTRRRHG